MAKYSSGLEDSLDLPDSSIGVLESRYLKRDENDSIIETGEQMYRRTARNVGSGSAFYLDGLKDKLQESMSTQEVYQIIADDPRVKKVEEEYFNLMSKGYFTPNSPTLMNAERRLQQLAACFVLPVGDSMEEIFDAIKNTALVHKSGGGTGFSFSRLRSRDSFVGSTGGVASGPISFMKIFNAATEEVKQGGKRRGANMGILRVDHPEIMRYIYAKRDNEDLNNFNLSVAITDDFMKAVRNDSNYKLINPNDNTIAGELNAQEVYNHVIHEAWANGDPGVIFIDTINKDNPTPEVGDIESTNPCGEQPLLPLEACNLGAVNLGKFVNEKGGLDEGKLEWAIRTGTRFLDDAITVSKYPIPEIDEMVKANRKIGLGVMGWADYLSKRDISYASEEALQEAEKIMKFITDTSVSESEKLASKRGAFPNFEKSAYAKKGLPPRRNATNTTIAPTGTTSIINSNASQGIEPLFAIYQIRNVEESIGKNLIEINPQFQKFLISKDMDAEGIVAELAKGYTIDDIFIPENIKQEIKRKFPTAHEISPEWHVRKQAAFQKYLHNAVSKTVNLPHDSTPEDVKKVYNLAYDLGCKGVTIYRDGSKAKQILTTGKRINGSTATLENLIKVPNIITSIKIKQVTPDGNMHVHLSIDPTRNYEPIEAFGSIANAGKKAAAGLEAIGRMTSKSLRGGGNSLMAINELKDIGGERGSVTSSGLVSSIPQGFAYALMKYELARRRHPIEDILLGKVDFDELDEKVSEIIRDDSFSKYLNQHERKSLKKSGTEDRFKCPDCGDKLAFLEGCKKCPSCGFDACG